MKKFLNLKSLLCCVAVVFGLIAAFMLFAPAITEKTLGVLDYNGSDIAFGKKVEGYGESYGLFTASAYMLPLFLALIGVALSVLAFLGKGGKIVPVIAAVCFLGAAIIYFLPLQLARPDGNGEKVTSDDVKEFRDGMKEMFKLAAGSIVGGIFSIIAACAVAVPLFIKSGSAE